MGQQHSEEQPTGREEGDLGDEMAARKAQREESRALTRAHVDQAMAEAPAELPRPFAERSGISGLLLPKRSRKSDPVGDVQEKLVADVWRLIRERFDRSMLLLVRKQVEVESDSRHLAKRSVEVESDLRQEALEIEKGCRKIDGSKELVDQVQKACDLLEGCKDLCRKIFELLPQDDTLPPPSFKRAAMQPDKA